MATARVSFVTPPSTGSGESSPASLAVPLETVASSDEKTAGKRSELKARLDGIAHLVVAPERLAVVGAALASNPLFEIFLGRLDEAPQSPRNVTVMRIRKVPYLLSRPPSNLAIVKFIQVWKDLKHQNVLGLLGYTLKHENEINQLIVPYLLNRNIRDFLNQAPVGVAQRLELVRDVAAGLDYLHNQSPPVCHGSLDPRKILIDENFNAVLMQFELDKLHPGLWSEYRYILTDIRPFENNKSELDSFYSFLHREAPGRHHMLLDLVPDAPKPEYASTLRLLHSYLPLCWEYEPKKRPPISVLRCQVFMFSFEDDAGDSVVATLEELAHLLVPPERLRLVEYSELGEGNYGEVFLGTLDEASETPRDVAVKRLKAVGTRGERVRLAKRLARELNIWAKIKHPNVVELIGYYLDEKYESPLLISALMTNGNVLSYIERHKPDIERRIAFVKGITAGLACLHSFDPAICHADLKPANVLIDLQMNAVLCDFGLASFVSGFPGLSGLVTTTSLKGTPRYMSPELLMESNCKHNLESDVWAWACTVFQVLTGRIPYAETGDIQFYLAIDRKELPGNVTHLLPNDAKVVNSESALTLRFLSSILPQCWEFYPQNRPSIRTLLSDLSITSPQTGAEANRRKKVASRDTQAQQVPPDPSSRQRTSFNDNEDVASGSLEERMKLSETSQDPPGTYPDVESAQGDKQTVPDEVHPKGDGANEESSRASQDAPAINSDADHEAQFREDDKTVIPRTEDRSSLKISIQPLSAFIWATVLLILSLSANIVLVLLLRKADPLPLRDQEISRPTCQKRDL